MGEKPITEFHTHITMYSTTNVWVRVIQQHNPGDSDTGEVILDRVYQSMYVAQEMAKNTINKALKKLKKEQV